MSTAQAHFTEIAVTDIHCPSCAATIERHLKQLGGVTACQVNFATGRVGVGYHPEQITLFQLEAALAEMGHPVRRREPPPGRARLTPERLRLLATASAGLFALTGSGLRWLDAPAAGWLACYLLAIASGWIFIAPKAWLALRSRHTADIHVLITVAVIGAAAIGQWAEAASVLFLFSVAEALESYSVDRTRQAFRGLMELAPEEATLLHHGHEATTPVQDVTVGQTILVRPGGRVPLDGEVIEGRSSVNEAAITGEAVPVARGPGDTVYAGTLNEAGRLIVRVTRAAGDTTLARIIALMEEAQAQRSPTEQFVDRFARWYTPAILGLAALLVVIPPLFGGDLRQWFYHSLSLLIIACPCALVISTPVAVVCGLARAARSGVLIKGGVHLERLGILQAVALDKTGTLTHGQMVVSDVIALAEMEPDAVLALAAAAESGSEHALGRAIVEAAREREIAIAPVVEFEAVPGLGVRAAVGGESLVVGRPEWLREIGYETQAAQASIDATRAQGKTVILIARGACLVGAVALTARTREAAAGMVRELRRLGITRIAMLTGDHAATARAVAEAVGIDEYHAGLLPADKVTRVQRLRAEAGEVAMVGDGINDAPALAAAGVGIAMGAAGTDVALETADVALMGDDLSRLPLAIQLSRQTRRVIRQNIGFSIGVKVVFVALTLASVSSLWLAILADTGTSVLVVLNSLRLLRGPGGASAAAPRR